VRTPAESTHGAVTVTATADELDEARQVTASLVAVMAEGPEGDLGDPDFLAARREELAGEQFPPEGVDVEVVEVPGPHGAVPVRVLTPPGPVRAVVLDVHGGGWCMGTAASGDHTNAALARATGTVVASVDYRLAPEHPWPAAADDCELVARWLGEHAADRWGTEALVVLGQSAGAHLGLVTLLRLREDGLAGRVAGLGLAYGVFDLGQTPSQRAGDDAPVLPRRDLEACYELLLPGWSPDRRRHPAVSPLYADLSDLPPTLVSVGELDPLLDDSLFLADRLRAAGTTTRLDVYPECHHGFLGLPLRLGARGARRIELWVAALLDQAT
jgi:acetyl esterase/lipase